VVAHGFGMFKWKEMSAQVVGRQVRILKTKSREQILHESAKKIKVVFNVKGFVRAVVLRKIGSVS